MVAREVWSANELTVSIWQEDASGNVGALVRELAFVQSGSGKPIKQNTIIKEPGVGFEQVHTNIIGHELRLNELFQTAGEQLDPFMVQGAAFRIALNFKNDRYQAADNDPVVYAGCKPTSGPDISYQDNKIVIWDAVFTCQQCSRATTLSETPSMLPGGNYVTDEMGERLTRDAPASTDLPLKGNAVIEFVGWNLLTPFTGATQLRIGTASESTKFGVVSATATGFGDCRMAAGLMPYLQADDDDDDIKITFDTPPADNTGVLLVGIVRKYWKL